VRFLLEPFGVHDLNGLTAAAEAAGGSGLDGILLAESARLPAPLIAAAALAERVPDVLVAAEIPLGDRHPLEVAEEAVVTDLALAGRLVLVVRPARGAPERFPEAVDVLRHALSARPFRFDGEHWRVPANLPQNELVPEEQVRMMPAPPRVRLELWTSGAAGRAVALERSLGHLADAGDDSASLAADWAAADRSAATLGAPRGRREAWRGPSQLVTRLRAGRESFGQDWAAVAAPVDAAAELGSIVRPRLQLHRLPPGLEEFWDAERPWDR
jgi:alkanesulfonate monooxygenase SsuD/methylene tetrahydromethanopterin reductase-like flavin-dependent oxidoreductase (luciferase family)